MTETYNPQQLKIAAVSNGIHIFEADGEWLGDVVAKHVTEDACNSVASFLVMNNGKSLKVTVSGKTYELSINEEETVLERLAEKSWRESMEFRKCAQTEEYETEETE